MFSYYYSGTNYLPGFRQSSNLFSPSASSAVPSFSCSRSPSTLGRPAPPQLPPSLLLINRGVPQWRVTEQRRAAEARHTDRPSQPARPQPERGQTDTGAHGSLPAFPPQPASGVVRLPGAFFLTPLPIWLHSPASCATA